MSRDDARAVFAATGLTYYDITESRLVDLRNMLDRSMKASGLMEGMYRMRRLKPRFKGTHQRPWADLRCKSDYFDDREAVTFNPDGFVGFAGWADDTNVQPILAGFCEWVASLSTHAAQEGRG